MPQKHSCPRCRVYRASRRPRAAVDPEKLMLPLPVRLSLSVTDICLHLFSEPAPDFARALNIPYLPPQCHTCLSEDGAGSVSAVPAVLLPAGRDAIPKDGSPLDSCRIRAGREKRFRRLSEDLCPGRRSDSAGFSLFKILTGIFLISPEALPLNIPSAPRHTPAPSGSAPFLCGRHSRWS